MTPKQMGRLGLFHIEEAILEVLSEELEGLTPSRISIRIGILGYSDPGLSLRYAIVHGALVQLKRQELIERVRLDNGEETSRWKLTEQSIRLRIDNPR